MEIEKLSINDLRNLNDDRIKELQTGIRKELNNIRLDIYSEKKVHLKKMRALKKNLAQIMTIDSEKKLRKSNDV